MITEPLKQKSKPHVLCLWFFDRKPIHLVPLNSHTNATNILHTDWKIKKKEKHTKTPTPYVIHTPITLTVK